MRMLSFSMLCLAFGVAVLGGCGRHARPVPAAEMPAGVRPDFQLTWDASLDVLRRYHFEIDEQDRRSGKIQTDRMVGQYLTEFWRRDAATPYNLLEGSLHTIYRRATVTIEKGDAGYEPRVEVVTSRSNDLSTHVTSTSEAFDLFRAAGRTRKKLTPAETVLVDEGTGRRETARGARVRLGRDEALERRIRRDILARRAALAARR